MSNFWARTITGLSMVFLILASLYFSVYFFAALFLLITVLGLLEFYTISATAECRPQKITGTILGTLIYAVLTVLRLCMPTPNMHLYVGLLLPIALIPVVIELYRKKEKPLMNIAMTLFGFLYVAVPLALLNLMYDPSTGTVFGHFPAYLTAYFLITWIYDTGAYLTGITFGKHKFFERISPKKTWEGTIGGLVVAFLAAVGFYYIADGITIQQLFVLTGLIVVFGTFGDLVESLFKRSLDLKDSGTILPGHGGILDRFDTLFISAPFVFLFFILLITL